MSISSGPGLDLGNRYRVAWQRRQAAQNVQDLLTREDAILLARNANQMNPDVPHWVERLNINRNRFLRDEGASSQARERPRQSCWSDFCEWLSDLFGLQNNRPVRENRLELNRADARVHPHEELSPELASRDVLEAEEQSRLFFPDHQADKEDAEKLFAIYPLLAQDLWQRYRTAFGHDDTAQRLDQVRHWTRGHLERKRKGQDWELQALEESL